MKQSRNNLNIEPRNFLSYNVAGEELRKKRKLLLYGTCIFNEYPDILKKWSKGRVPLSVCLEREHMNMVALKLASLLARIPLEELVILTVDGSPHCVQLHMTVEEVLKIVKNITLKVKHLVIENGKVIEIDPKCVKIARYLSKIMKLLREKSSRTIEVQ